MLRKKTEDHNSPAEFNPGNEKHAEAAQYLAMAAGMNQWINASLDNDKPGAAVMYTRLKGHYRKRAAELLGHETQSSNPLTAPYK